tara:strand:+ start:932 stop:2731 length:1800 start_codon:yes stop_codon:yes gene_type:complete
MAFTSPSIPTKPNANNIMALLRTMSDDKLFQFAQAHKNDPYVFPLTFQESNSRKQLRVAQAGQNPPASEVVDQNLQEMAAPAPPQEMQPQQLPEDVGIGQLPAPNMQRMAAGGIVAFEEGGEVPRFQEGGFFRPSGVPSGAIIIGNMYIDPVTKERKYLPGQEPQRAPYAGQTLGQAAGRVGDFLSNLLSTPEQQQKEIKPDARRIAIAAEDKQDIEDRNARALSAQIAAATGAGAGIGTPTTSAPGAGQGIKPGGGQGINPAAGGQGLPSIQKPQIPELAPEIKALNTKMPTAFQAQGIAAQFLDEDKYAQQLKDFEKEEAAAIAKRRTKLEESLGKMPERYKNYEERLKAQEKEDAGDKEKLTGMSFLEAGLAVLSGESPNAFVNLGRAKEGVKTYNEGIKDIKRSARERDKAFGDIENARQAQAEGKIDAMNRFEDSAAKSLSESKRWAVSGLQSLGMKGAELSKNTYDLLTNNAYANQRAVAGAAQALQTTALGGDYSLEGVRTQVEGAKAVANIKAATDREYAQAFRQGQLNLTTQKAIDDALAKWAKTNRYTEDDPQYHIERQRLVRVYTAANPGMAQSGRAPGGGADPLGIR